MTLNIVRWTDNPRLFLIILLACGTVSAADRIVVEHQAVDYATLNTAGISKAQTLVVRLFDSSNANLGKPKHHDTAQMLANTAPHLLAVDVVESLRQMGFSDVVLDESGEQASADQLVLTGRFTELNPGSQAARAWIGFGAGESKVCLEGQVVDGKGQQLAEFSHCRKGLGWGESGAQMEKGAERVGDSIARFLADWANGVYR